MESEHGFQASKAQYERKLKNWGFKKYLTEEDWICLNRTNIRKERKRGGGIGLEIYSHGGIRISAAKVRRGIARNVPLSLATWKRSPSPAPLSPQLNAAFVVCSPPPPSISILWPNDMPFLRFRKEFYGHAHSFIPINPSGELVLATSSSITARLVSEQITALGSLFTWTGSHNLQKAVSAPWTTAVLSAIMPEDHEGQNRAIAEKLCDLQGGTGVLDLLLTRFFLLSNNFIPKGEKTLAAHDEQILNLLRQVVTGLQGGAEVLKKLLSADLVATQAIKEQLLKSAVRGGDLQLLKVILEAGMDVDLGIELQPFYMITPNMLHM
ncbi:hypothetical protein B0T17DRAFT_651233, partial [Bombardia bombarda]